MIERNRREAGSIMSNVRLMVLRCEATQRCGEMPRVCAAAILRGMFIRVTACVALRERRRSVLRCYTLRHAVGAFVGVVVARRASTLQPWRCCRTQRAPYAPRVAAARARNRRVAFSGVVRVAACAYAEKIDGYCRDIPPIIQAE